MTEQEEEDEQERKDEECDRLRGERHRHLSPQCCEGMRRCKAIYARVSDDGKTTRWAINLASEHFNFDSTLWRASMDWYRDASKDATPFVPAPTHCLFCGEKLPALVRKAIPPAPLHVWEEPGYCKTCGERCANCACWSPEAAWECT